MNSRIDPTVKVVCGVGSGPIGPRTIVKRGGSVEFFFAFMNEYIDKENAFLFVY